MQFQSRFALGLLAALVVVFFLTAFIPIGEVAVLSPSGPISAKERELMLTAVWLMLLVVVPVIALTFFIAWKYRADNSRARYEPTWDFNHWLEAIWWLVPCAIIATLSAIAWQSSHELDPYRPLSSDKKPLVVQVVALQWKWLFIYPEQKVASVGHLQLPQGVPVHFELTSDAPMNSFWIPKLGSQIYAMPGMKTQLNLLASEPGNFRGCSANLSGEGFASMNFAVRSGSMQEFEQWLSLARSSPSVLERHSYLQLAQPSREREIKLYRLGEAELFDWTIMQYAMCMPQEEKTCLEN